MVIFFWSAHTTCQAWCLFWHVQLPFSLQNSSVGSVVVDTICPKISGNATLCKKTTANLAVRPQRASAQFTSSLGVQRNPMKIICAYRKYFGNHLGRTTQLISSKKILLISTYKCSSVARIHRIQILLAWSRDHVFPTSLIIIVIKCSLLKTNISTGFCCKLSNSCALLRLTICHMFSYWKSQFFLLLVHVRHRL
jgi:hypothetical protein